jgi:FAD/FMN-containing dehydrogenase
MHKQQDISGWGNFPRALCRVFRPEKLSSLPSLQKSLGSWLARGAGCSYGDASLYPEAVITAERLNLIDAFDSTKGVVTVYAGVTIKELLEVVVKKGWMLPVVPGTQYATIGGCVASNVHGKNHALRGGFSTTVKKLYIRLASGKLIECGPKKNPDYFRATCGGMGMTGVIERVTLQLQKTPSTQLRTVKLRFSKLDSMLKQLLLEDEYSYHVGWVNHFSKDFPSVLYKGQEADGAQDFPAQKEYSIPLLSLCSMFLPFAVKLMNHLRFYWGSRKEKTQDMRKFLFPLDRLRNWNHVYGKNGLVQYQFVLPQSDKLIDDVTSLLVFLKEQRCYSNLVVVKKHSADDVLLPFAIDGISVAMDFPNSSHVRTTLDLLSEQVIKLGGRVYLAKDSILKKVQFEAMYKADLPAWKAALCRIDPTVKIQSLMSQRLGFKEYE